ncbi:hypothetical protein FPQ18DRAFT_378363 [Pyronema domesticum]|nr:hypothetical protein FPQ18DRAFT_378363 [Pyronema domesticum]
MHLSTVLLTLSLTATSLASFCYPTGNSALTSAVTARHRQFCTYASRYSPINPGEKVSFTYETTLPNGAPGRIFYQYHNKSNKKWYILQTPCEADIGWLVRNCGKTGVTRGGVVDFSLGTLTVDVQDTPVITSVHPPTISPATPPRA